MRTERVVPTLAVLILLPSVFHAQSQEPRIAAVTNLASYAEGPLSPGQMVVIWGSGLGPSALVTHQLDAGGRLASKLSEVEVLFDGVPTPLLYVSEHQTAAVVPRSVAGRVSTAIAVVHAGRTSDIFRQAVAANSVGVFTADSSGTGLVAALNADYSYNDASHPAEPGSWITFFLTGTGDTNPAGIDGLITTGAVPILAPVSVRLGLRESTLLYAGSAPGAVFGLSQINVVVPNDLPNGGSFPLTVTVGDSKSQDGVVVYVRGAAPPVLAAPAGLSAVAVGANRVRLVWRSSDGLAETFRVERQRDDSGFVELAAADSPAFLDVGVEPGVEYAYRVRAEGVSGFSEYSNEVRVTGGLSAAEISLVISQVYVNDWLGVRLYRSDFAEILNVGLAAQDLNGLSLQTTYAAYGWKATSLSGSLQPGQRYLIELAHDFPCANVPLPAPDAAGESLLSSFIGSVALVRGVQPLPTAWPGIEEMVDLFAYGRLDTVYNGRPFVGPLGTMAFFRKSGGCQNTEDNAADFYSAPPDPRNTQSPLAPCPPESLAPSVAPLGVRNAATLRKGPLAPGTLAIVEGTRFSPGHIKVFFGGFQAPVYSATTDRLLVGVPGGIAGKAAVDLIVRADGRDSPAYVVELAEVSPGIFSRMSAQLDALPPLNDGGTRNGPEAPAREGSIVTVSVTGLGLPLKAPTATIGGRPAEVLDLRPAASRMREIYNLTLRVPDGLEGAQPLEVQAGPASSPPVYLNLTAPAPRHDDFGLLRIDARDLAYDSFRDVLYVASQSGESGVINMVDPRLRSVIGYIPCGTSPDHLTVSANGRYLWLTAGPAEEVSIQRIDLDKREIEFSVTLRELFSDQPGRQGSFGVFRMRAHPNDEELLVAATFIPGGATPLIALEGPTRKPRLGPNADSIIFLEDGSFWTDSHRLTVGSAGIYPLRTASTREDILDVTLAFENRILDVKGVVRDQFDLGRVGFVGLRALFRIADMMVYRPEDKRLYVGGGVGGAQNYAIEAFDPFKMIPVGGFIFYYHLAGDLSPSGSSLPRRFVSVGSEGFATVFPSYNPGDGRGGVYFFPLSIIQDRPGVPIPPPQPRNDAIRQIPVPAEGAAVDPVSGKVYLSIPSAAGKIGNTIAPFDPNSGLFDEPIWVGSDPRVSRVTPDGQYLYVHLFGSRTVKRFRLPGLEFDLEFPVIDDSGFTTNASAILNVPNAPSSTIAVERTAFGPTATSNGVAIYDDGVRRPKTSGSCDPCTGIEAGVGSNSTQFSSSGSHLFAIDSHEGPFFPFSRWFLTPEGLVIDAKKVGLSAGYLARLRCAQSVCVTSSGVLFDPYIMERIRMFGDAAIDHAYGSFASNTLVALDAVGNRVFFLVDGDLRSYELSTGKLNGTLPGPFPGVDLQILPSGDVMILGFSGVVLIPERQLP